MTISDPTPPARSSAGARGSITRVAGVALVLLIACPPRLAAADRGPVRVTALRHTRSLASGQRQLRLQPRPPAPAQHALELAPHGEAKQGEAKQGEAKQGEAKHGEAKHGEAKHGDAKRGDAKASSGGVVGWIGGRGKAINTWAKEKGARGVTKLTGWRAIAFADTSLLAYFLGGLPGAAAASVAAIEYWTKNVWYPIHDAAWEQDGKVGRSRRMRDRELGLQRKLIRAAGALQRGGSKVGLGRMVARLERGQAALKKELDELEAARAQGKLGRRRDGKLVHEDTIAWSVLKAFSWRVLGSIDTAAIVVTVATFTGSPLAGALVAGLHTGLSEVGTKIPLFFTYERAWQPNGTLQRQWDRFAEPAIRKLGGMLGKGKQALAPEAAPVGANGVPNAGPAAPHDPGH